MSLYYNAMGIPTSIIEMPRHMSSRYMAFRVAQRIDGYGFGGVHVRQMGNA